MTSLHGLGRYQSWEADQFGLSILVEDAIYTDDGPVLCDGPCKEMFTGDAVVVSLYAAGYPEKDIIYVLAFCPKCSKEWRSE